MKYSIVASGLSLLGLCFALPVSAQESQPDTLAL